MSEPHDTAAGALGGELERPGDAAGEAVRRLRSGWSCAEAVVLSVAPHYPPDLREPQRLATAFGGGIARRGLLCGCVTGAAVALGAAMGRASADDTVARERVYAAADRVLSALAARFGSLECRALTGLDFALPAAREEWESRVREQLCVHLVRATAALVAAELEAAASRPGLGCAEAPRDRAAQKR